VLWHTVQDKTTLFKEEQLGDPPLKALMDRLPEHRCPRTCLSKCQHSVGCLRRHRGITRSGVLLCVSTSRPYPLNATSMGLMRKLLDTKCQCTEPEQTCIHSKWVLKENPKPDPTVEVPPELKGLTLHQLRRRVILPEKLVESVLYHCHGHGVAGHPGINKLSERVCSRFYWKSMRNHVRRWVLSCLRCQRRKPCKPHNVVQPGVMTPPSIPMAVLFIDFSGPYPETKRGNKYILTIVCASTRWPISVPLPARSADLVVQALLEHVIQHYSCPRMIILDRAKEFIGHTLRDFCRIFGIQRAHTPRYAPSLRPYVERYMAWQAAGMTILTSRFKDTWDLVLPLVTLSYRTSVTATTGFSPFRLQFAREPNMPFDTALDEILFPDPEPEAAHVQRLQNAMKEVFTAVQRAQQQRSLYDRKNREDKSRKIRYLIDDFALVWEPKTEILAKHMMDKPKLKDRWSLPVRVLAKTSEDSYVVRDQHGELTDVRADLMTPYRFYFDGKPSIPSRLRITPLERRALNRNPETKCVLPRVRVGELVVFPLSNPDGTAGFGIGKALSFDEKAGWNLHWYSNDAEDCTGPLYPCFQSFGGSPSWYAGVRRDTRDTPLETYLTYPSPITRDVIAATGFQLQPDHRTPLSVLRQIASHPRYEWKTPDSAPHTNPEAL